MNDLRDLAGVDNEHNEDSHPKEESSRARLKDGCSERNAKGAFLIIARGGAASPRVRPSFSIVGAEKRDGSELFT